MDKHYHKLHRNNWLLWILWRTKKQTTTTLKGNTFYYSHIHKSAHRITFCCKILDAASALVASWTCTHEHEYIHTCVYWNVYEHYHPANMWFWSSRNLKLLFLLRIMKVLLGHAESSFTGFTQHCKNKKKNFVNRRHQHELQTKRRSLRDRRYQNSQDR